MRNLWAIDTAAFQAFLLGMQIQLKAWPNIEQFAGPIEDAQRHGIRVKKQGSTAVVDLVGPMMKNVGWLGRLLGFTSTTDVQMAIRASALDDDVTQIVLRIDSPGGEVAGLVELGNEIEAVSKTKRVTAQVDGMAASAAYWVASRATTINAGKLDMVGSIGVRILLYDFSEMFKEAGIRPVPIDTGEYKSLGAMGTEVTENHEVHLQHLVDDTFKEFKAVVMDGRGLTSEQFDKVADGRVFHAHEAVGLGLVDQIQTMDQTMALIQQQNQRRQRSAARLKLSRQ